MKQLLAAAWQKIREHVTPNRIRVGTAVPVGWGLAWLAEKVDVQEVFDAIPGLNETSATIALGSAAVWVYYVIGDAVEKRWPWLRPLGSRKQPANRTWDNETGGPPSG